MSQDEPIKRSQKFWDEYFMSVAERTAQLSKDPNRQVGSVLVTPSRRQMSIGYNGLPSDIPDIPSLLADKAAKQPHMVHAEKNCLEQAPFEAEGCTMYVTRFPCEACAQLIIDAKLSRVVAPRPDYAHLRWGVSWYEAATLLEVGNVQLNMLGEQE